MMLHHLTKISFLGNLVTNHPLARNEITGWQGMKSLAGRIEIACGKK
jgi:hypothetical protein